MCKQNRKKNQWHRQQNKNVHFINQNEQNMNKNKKRQKLLSTKCLSVNQNWTVN